MQSAEKTVPAYIKSLPLERAKVIKEIRKLVNDNINEGFVEVMRWGMISWEVPLSKFPNTYNGQPLNYIGLAAQKHSYSLYLMSCYGNDKARLEFENAYKESGKRIDMGKCCVRFKKVDDLPLPLIKKYIRKCSVNNFIRNYELVKQK